MSTIPPNWMGSILQSQGAQERAGQAKSAEEAKGAQRADFTDQLRDMIENSDHDAEVYSDAEGNGGGRGSPFSEPEEGDEVRAGDEEGTEAEGGGLDLQA